METATVISGSFRDPSGFLFYRKGLLYRQVNDMYSRDYAALVESGLYEVLVSKRMLIPHTEVLEKPFCEESSFKVIQPELVFNISYPYEWCFSQLKDAALLTISIQQKALEHGLSLKDASSYNVQFHKNRPIFIDTLSFEKYQEGAPWVAYKQFCQHFIAPLALMAKVDIRLSKLLSLYIDGIPLDLASKLLPASSKINLSLGMHIHLHAKTQIRHASNGGKASVNKLTKTRFIALLDSLQSTINKLKWEPKGTEWYDYYSSNNNYEKNSLSAKEEIVLSMIKAIEPVSIWDLGANVGRFSKIASKYCQHICAWDIDPACVEINYRETKKDKSNKVLPLLLDLTNPSPAIGWDNKERLSLVDRGPVDLILALGLVHHLAISNNVPLDKIAKFIHNISKSLVIEFIPKEDSQVEKLLLSRKDIFPTYNQQSFEAAFSKYFSITTISKIPNTKRILYVMKANQ